MSSIRYYNQTAPFWDWVASIESAAADHPFFNAYNPQAGEAGETNRQGPPHSPHHEGPSTPNHSHDGPPPPPEPHHPDGPPPPPEPHHPGGSPPHHHHHRHEGPPGCGWGRHGHRGGHHRGFGGPHCGRGGNPFGNNPRGSFGGGFGGFQGFQSPAGPFPFDISSIAQFLGQQLGLNPEATTNNPNPSTENDKSENPSATTENKDKDFTFTPPCDVFDTEDAYIIHLSLPGAKKEDVGVNWDADKSELSVAGVIYRPGDEDLLKTLAMDERQVGVFERKVRLGSRARPAMVEADGIGARMEDGILIVRVPKVDAEYVDVRKVEIE
ncbi:MAG: hypothetical protein Q9187_005580 [Circinaria calcarea]